jgi:putative ABC transport system permease protein
MKLPQQSPSPPQWANKLLAWLCPDGLLEEVQGDLQELFEEQAAEAGLKQARKEYVWSVLGYMRPYAFKRNTSKPPKPLYKAMLVHYFLSAIRNMSRQKVNTFINVFGLSLSIAFCLLIFLFTKDEFSFDRFHKEAHRIYRLHQIDYVAERPLQEAKTGWLSALKMKGERKQIVLSPLIGPAIGAEVPEIAQTLRYQVSSGIFSSGEESFQEQITYVDKNFFQFFSFPLLQGNAATVLANPSGIVITPDIARKYFGKESPLGKPLYYQKNGKTATYVVTGLARQAPANSSISFEILIRYENNPVLDMDKDQLRFYNTTNTFVKLTENASLQSLHRNLNGFMERQYGDQISYYRKEKNLQSTQPVYAYGITNIADTHFDNSADYWPKVSNPLYAYILLTIAGFIVLMACINYITLALAGASGRIREISVRKLIGAQRRQVIFQLWAETQLMVILSILLSLLLVALFLPAFNYFTDKSLTTDLLLHPQIVGALLLLSVAMGVVAGGYPALLLTGFQPVSILKSKSTYRINPWFSRVLVVVQYSLCLFLVSSTIIVYQQMRFISQKDLGYNTDQILIVRNYAQEGEPTLKLLDRLKQQAAIHPDILSVSATSSTYGNGGMFLGFEIDGKQLHVRGFYIDHHFIPDMELAMTEGRNFSDDMGTEEESVIVNETLAAILGGSQIVGTIPKDFRNQKVVGIVKDHHYESLENKIGPAIYFYKPQKATSFLLKISHQNIVKTVESLQGMWKAIAPGQVFTYTFLDETVAQQYTAYQKWSAIIGSATLFAIFIAGLGLFGLAGLVAVNRTKEVGIRKVLGASVPQLFMLINKGITGLILLSFVIAVPMSVYVMQGWLDDFAYRVDISWITFAIVGLVSILIASVSVSYYSIKAAIANPVKSLRSE